MRCFRHAPQTMCLLVTFGGIVLAGLGAELRAKQLPDVSIPANRDLLRDPPFDRLTLIDGTILFVDPVSPRPLPDKEELRAAESKESPRFERVGGLLVSKAPELNRDPSDNAIVIRTQEDEPRDYYVKITSIQSADYFDDILLAEALRRAQSNDFDRAFELVLAVRSRDPNWRGLRETADRIIFLEGQHALDRGQVDDGLRLLGQLHDRAPETPNLKPLLAKGYAGRIESAIEQGAYALGRRVLTELRNLTPEAPEVARMEQRFISLAQRLAEEADRLEGPDRVERLADALRVWPNDEAIAARYQEAFLQFPVLDVAVLDVPRRPGPFLECPADTRVMSLLYRPILAESSEQATRGELPDQLAAELTIGEIGRRLELRIKKGITWNDGSRSINAIDVARTLTDRALPSTLGYDARWADLLTRVRPIDDTTLEVTLKRTPLDPAAWLLLPAGPAHAGRDGLVWTPSGPRPIGSGLFTLGPLTRSTARIDRADRLEEGTPSLARINERRYEPPTDPVAALRRGEVTLLESVPHDRVRELENDPEIQIGRYRAPRMHWIALDGRNPLLRNRSLRRGLSFAINREELLQERILRAPLDETSIPSDGPFPAGSATDDPEVSPLTHDPLLAKMLVRAAKQEMGIDAIELTLAYPSIPSARAVVSKLVDAFADAGVVLNPVERPQSDLETELRQGARFDLAYRVASISNPMLEIGPVLCPGYSAPPQADGLGALASARMLQLLLRLEQVQDLPSAREQLLLIDRETRDELPILPLWQLKEQFAWRTRLTGPSHEVDELYEGIESWTIEPWFSRDLP
ncbi:ABC transporter substrate-binding protein [Tautonia marina]|uniref:ABC transporter substrate-binding protein n=1 Tax=Tautonia marina TaxID=2653855 RepID=UPI0013764129|nr:ABC transporter substrate-binding protein [Tautonia marina]